MWAEMDDLALIEDFFDKVKGMKIVDAHVDIDGLHFTFDNGTVLVAVGAALLPIEYETLQ